MYGTYESSSGEDSDEETAAGTAVGSSDNKCQDDQNPFEVRASPLAISWNDFLDSDGCFFDTEDFPDRSMKKRTTKKNGLELISAGNCCT